MENFTKIKFTYFDEIENKNKVERMWASKFGDNYKLENSPFYVTGYSFGDIISAKSINNELFVDELIEASGNSTVQIIFFKEDIVKKTRDEFKKMGCDSELSNIPTLVSIDIPPNIRYFDIIKPYLEEGVTNELWDYQEACLAHESKQQNDLTS